VTDVLPVIPPTTATHSPLDWRGSWGPAPRWATPRSPERPTYGGVVARLARELGLPLMPWQAYVVDVAHEVDPVTGWWAYDEVVVTVPRQAGKTTLLVPVYVQRLSSIELASLWMTAQSGGKALARWNAARKILERSVAAPQLRAFVSIGHERIEWLSTGSTLVPFTPNEEAMHGESPDAVFVDEWWAFKAVEASKLIGSYSPGFLTKNAQAWKTSTAGTKDSAGLNASVTDGRAAVELGRRSGTAYFEWSLPDMVDGIPYEELPDEQLIVECIKIHPAIGFHPRTPAEKMRHHIRTELQPGVKLDRQEFIRAYGNRASNVGSGWQVISEPAWVATMASKAIPPGVPVGLGFDVDPDGRDAAVAVAWRDGSGRATVEIVKTAEGSRWIADAVPALEQRWKVTQVAVNNAGPAREAADVVEQRGVELLRLTQMDYGAACARFVTEVTMPGRPLLQHIGQPSLNAAVEHAGKRKVGADGAWGWRRDAEVSVSPLVAVTAAVWAVDHPRETEPDIGPFWIR